MAETFTIGVDLGGTKLLAALVDETGRIRERREEPTEAKRGADAVIGSIARLVAALDAEAKKQGGAVRGVGVGAPGPLDPKTGVVSTMPNLGPTWTGYPLRARLQAAAGKAIQIENDAKAATLGEAWVGAAAGQSEVVMLTLGTGVGGGIIANGGLVRGARGAAGELGHTVVERDGHPCGCGGHGCLEQYASGTALSRIAGEELARAPRGGLAALGRAPIGKDVIALARSGDELALAIVSIVGRALGTGLVSIVHALNPAVVVIGGGLGAAAFDLLVPIARRELDSRSLGASHEGLAILGAKLGNDAGVVGAARSSMLS